VIGINKIDLNVESDVSIITCHVNNFEKKKKMKFFVFLTLLLDKCW
jgi:hypothetical protein